MATASSKNKSPHSASLNPNQQLLAARVFNQSSQSLKNEQGEGGPQAADNYNDSALAEAGDRFRKSIMSGKKSAALKQGALLGKSLRSRINEGKFDGKTFMLVLLLSLIKDIIDVVSIASLGLIGTIVNAFITPALFFIFFLRRSRLRRFLIKKLIWPIVGEFVPLFNSLPLLTTSTILMKLKADKETRKLEDQYKDVMKQIGEVNRSPRGFVSSIKQKHKKAA